MMSLAQAALLSAIAATTFLEQDIRGVHVGRVNPWTGRASGNYRSTDVDGDGNADVVLPREVAFQRDGTYTQENTLPLPAEDTQAASQCDIWGRHLYMRSAGRLAILAWEDGKWRHVLRQDIAWPDGAMAGQRPDARHAGGLNEIRFGRFLHDFDSDGTPELAIPSADGLHILDRPSEFYEEVARLDIFPPLQFSHAPIQRLWPPGARRVEAPVRRLACRYWIEDTTLDVVVRDYLSDGRVRFETTRYTIAAQAPFGLVGEPSAREVTRAQPGFVEPCRLNDDGVMDFVGAQWEVGDDSILPSPVHETYFSTDGGNTSRVVRSRAFRPLAAFVDFDGDGRLDLVTQRTGLFDGGPRETISRFTTQRRIAHEVGVHLQSPEARYPEEPDVKARFVLEMDRALVANSDMFRRYQAGELVNLTGDFNGDGRRDTLVQDRPDRLALYLTSDGKIPRRPSATLAIRDEWSFAVADIDGDGRSDIVVRWTEPGTEDGHSNGRVFLVRESGS